MTDEAFNYEDQEANPSLEDKDEDLYDLWRDNRSEEFDDDLNELIARYKAKKSHYMNDLGHVIESLRSSADFLERYKMKGDKK